MAPRLTRRSFIAVASVGPLALVAACSPTEPEFKGPARLDLRARKPTRGTLTGTDVLYGKDFHRAYVRVPPTYNASTPTPLILLLHGAGSRGDTIAATFGSRTDALGAIALAPNSLRGTWDILTGNAFEEDVPFIDLVLDQVFDRCNIDTSRIAMLGFSDGASYALTLGLSNGDQLAGVVAFSPGFYELSHPRGSPQFFISHGTSDVVIPIEQSSRLLVPALEARGSSVTYVEFDGGHTVSVPVADQAMTWLDQRF
jgi:phospholipase/carboxylesterase